MRRAAAFIYFNASRPKESVFAADEIIPHQMSALEERERTENEAPKMSNSNSENSGGSSLSLFTLRR